MAQRTATTLEAAVATADPAELLDFAWAMEPPSRLNDRSAALARLRELLDTGAVPTPPPGRDWQLELWAELAVDASAADRLEEALELSQRVLDAPDSAAELAVARATYARGRALAWLGTEETTRAGEALLLEATARFAAMEQTDWQGFTLFWRGHAICYENGRLHEAEALMAEALEVLAYSSPRRATVLSYYADTLADLGEWDRAEAALDEGYRLAETADNAMARAYVTWTRARVAAGRGDAVRSERLFREVERDATDWWRNSGAYFLCDAARTLDTLGLTHQAHSYLARAEAEVARDGGGSGRPPEEFEPLAVARALVSARSGDPTDALDQFQGLTRRRWLEKRLLWRFTLLGAWATLRAGNRQQAAVDAARAFAEAEAAAGIRIALAGEPEITRALAPLAAEAGSAPAHRLLAGDGECVVRLFGVAGVSTASGEPVALPAGKPGELVRMLAVAPHGLAVDLVLEAFFPDVEPTTARHRLRQVLTRLRTAAGDLVVRDGEMLKLAPAWVDVREFRALAQRARASRGTRALILRHAALALADRGPLLVGDPYTAWAEEARAEIAAEAERLSRHRG